MTRHDGLRVAVAVTLLAPIAVLMAACTASTSSDSPASGTSAASAVSEPGTGALAFARCMRANGLPKWPDPTGSGVFNKSQLQQTGYTQAQTRAVEDGPCKNVLPTAAPSASASPTITVQQQQDYLDAVACMRSHGITNFPDPTFSGGHVTLVPPPGLQTSGTLFTQAQHICQQLIPAGLPYSRSDG
jgi:hypothetical protein